MGRIRRQVSAGPAALLAQSKAMRSP